MGAKRKILGKLAKKLHKEAATKTAQRAATKTAQRTKYRIKSAKEGLGTAIPKTARQIKDADKTAKKVEGSIARNKRKKTKRVTRRKNRNLRKREERNWRAWTKELQPTEQASTRKKKVRTRKKTGRKFQNLDDVKSAGIGNTVAGSYQRKRALEHAKARMSTRKRAKGRPAGSRGKKTGKPLSPNPRKLSDYEEKILKDDLRGRKKVRSRPKTRDEVKAENARKSSVAARSGARKDKRMIQKSRFSKQAPSKSRIKREIDLQAADLRNEAVQKVGKALQQRKRRWGRKAAMKSRVGKTRYPRKKITRN